mmetsp:Transcript_29853/g.48161  ORF Transcript_29853/g.48161 Transcript_29853/m.48161 type:complete len:254 (+) Transcript_29853:321-1082(+)
MGKPSVNTVDPITFKYGQKLRLISSSFNCVLSSDSNDVKTSARSSTAMSLPASWKNFLKPASSIEPSAGLNFLKRSSLVKLSFSLKSRTNLTALALILAILLSPSFAMSCRKDLTSWDARRRRLHNCPTRIFGFLISGAMNASNAFLMSSSKLSSIGQNSPCASGTAACAFSTASAAALAKDSNSDGSALHPRAKGRTKLSAVAIKSSRVEMAPTLDPSLTFASKSGLSASISSAIFSFLISALNRVIILSAL